MTAVEHGPAPHSVIAIHPQRDVTSFYGLGVADLSVRLKAVIDALPLRPGLRVNEVGCGPGALARALGTGRVAIQSSIGWLSSVRRWAGSMSGDGSVRYTSQNGILKRRPRSVIQSPSRSQAVASSS